MEKPQWSYCDYTEGGRGTDGGEVGVRQINGVFGTLNNGTAHATHVFIVPPLQGPKRAAQNELNTTRKQLKACTNRGERLSMHTKPC